MEKTFDDVATLELSGGIHMPQLAFGTYKVWPYLAQEAVEHALELGYRHIDTACAYANEEQVGAALAATGKTRETFVTTKLRNGEQGRDATRRACERSLKYLGVDAIDLYLIHWPVPTKDLYVETWETFIDLQQEGMIRAIGVSNFLPEYLDRLVAETGVVPVTNQIESHPRFWQPDIEAYCKEKGIAIEAYSPLGRGKDLEAEPVCAIAQRLGVTPAQAVLRWHVQKGHAVLPKSVHVERMKENMDIFSFELAQTDMEALDAMDSPAGKASSSDPRTFESPQDIDDMISLGSLKLEA